MADCQIQHGTSHMARLPVGLARLLSVLVLLLVAASALPTPALRDTHACLAAVLCAEELAADIIAPRTDHGTPLNLPVVADREQCGSDYEDEPPGTRLVPQAIYGRSGYLGGAACSLPALRSSIVAAARAPPVRV